MICPPCTKFCALQRLRKRAMDPAEWDQAVAMVDFAVEVAELQMRSGRLFAFEHPLTACSWALESLKRLRETSGVFDVVCDMCCFGLKSSDEVGEGFAKKPTRVLTNCEPIRDMLMRRCDKTHRHVQLVSGRAGPAQEYTAEFCRAIIEGLKHYLLAMRSRKLTTRTGLIGGGIVGVVGACS